VAVGDDKKPVAVPPLQPSTPEELRRFGEARRRKDSRLTHS
jgi:acyl-CoA hydrolase